MNSQVTFAQKLTAMVCGCIVSALIFALALGLDLPPNYSEFIVGSITWRAESKIQDLIVGPAFIISFFAISLLTFHSLNSVRKQRGEDHIVGVSKHMLYWAIPSLATIASVALGSHVDQPILIISTFGIAIIIATMALNSSKNSSLTPELVSLSCFATLLISALPLELALVVGRLQLILGVEIDAPDFRSFTYLIGIFCAAYVGYLSIFDAKRLKQILPASIILGQVGLLAFYLSLYPAIFLQTSGDRTEYQTTFWLKILILVPVIWGSVDLFLRKRNFTDSYGLSYLLSPIAIFALLVGLKFGATALPQINPDDYHFGESLLGWWSYLNGSIPYLDYIPAHGIVDDDLAQFVSWLAYDFSAASMPEASRLALVVLAFVAFISVFSYSGSIALAFASIFFLSGRPAWYFFVPFLCVFFSHRLRRNPSMWLITWMISIPVIILGVPPQGLLFVAATSVMACYFLFMKWREFRAAAWYGIVTTAVVLLLVCGFTPVGIMLLGAIRYVLENGSINQVAYGIPWDLSLTAGAGRSFAIEAIRMSWMLVSMALLFIVIDKRKEFSNPQSPVLPAIVALLFSFLLIPYSMGRIDPGGVSRPGLVGIFGWTVLLPIVAWKFVKQRDQIYLILLVAFMGALINSGVLSSSRILSAISSEIRSKDLTRAGAGLGNMGTASVGEKHLDRLQRLNDTLTGKLEPEESYLDLTSRNAQYFYLNRRPLLPVTAPYNMVSAAQQKRGIAQLIDDLPRYALLDGENITHDGGGLALRSPYLYRFVMNNYIPSMENGFIIGRRKDSSDKFSDSSLSVSVEMFTDENWHHGHHRSEAAVRLEDSVLFDFLKVDDQVRFSDGDVRKVTRVWPEGKAIWLSGGRLNFDLLAKASFVDILAKPEVIAEYRSSLFQKAFSVSNLQKIPIAWGRSENSLMRKMRLVGPLAVQDSSLQQVVAEGDAYRVDGDDPQLSLDISKMNVSGEDADILRFDFSCEGKTVDPSLQIFWWGDHHDEPFESSSFLTSAEDGALIVPMESAPSWVRLNKVRGLRIDLANASACRAFGVKNVGLYKRID